MSIKALFSITLNKHSLHVCKRCLRECENVPSRAFYKPEVGKNFLRRAALKTLLRPGTACIQV